ncbi:MAG: sugar transferase [Bacilli bacterium]|nr:sugar transferase [Bacilli bacterium]
MDERIVCENAVEMKKVVYFVTKRFLDILFSLVGFVFLIPLIFIVKTIYVINGDFHSMFFKQKRVGKNGNAIYIWKFRTMVPNAENILKEWLTSNPEIRKEYYKTRKLDHDPRITKVGNLLRISSLDELPQVINILKGDMSLIGPRPVLEDEAEEYAENKEKFLSMRPGLTGYWACNGRSCTSLEERRKLELYYVDHCSLWLDIKIIYWTVIKVIKSEGAK